MNHLLSFKPPLLCRITATAVKHYRGDVIVTHDEHGKQRETRQDYRRRHPLAHPNQRQTNQAQRLILLVRHRQHHQYGLLNQSLLPIL